MSVTCTAPGTQSSIAAPNASSSSSADQPLGIADAVINVPDGGAYVRVKYISRSDSFSIESKIMISTASRSAYRVGNWRSGSTTPASSSRPRMVGHCDTATPLSAVSTQ